MRKVIVPLCFLALLLSSVNLKAQLKQDSVYIGKGDAGTNTFSLDRRSLILEHDLEGRPLVLVNDRNVGGEWVPFKRRQFTYEDDQIVSLIIQNWSPDAEVYQDHQQRTFTYNTDLTISSRVYTEAPSPGESLVNNRRWSYAYNETGQLLAILFQRWESGDWINARRQLFRYQADGLLEEHLAQRWEAGEWQNGRRRLLSYDPDHQGLSRTLGQVWSEDEAAWVNTKRMNYNYTPNGIITSEQTQNWNPTTTAWVNDSRQLFTLGEQAQFQSRLRQVWQEEDWQNQFRGTQAVSNRSIDILFDAWQEDAQQWNPHSRHQLQYNAAGLLTLSQGWQRWSEELSSWINLATTRRYRFFWSEVVNTVRNQVVGGGCQMANPYPLGAAIRCENLSSKLPLQVELFDQLGRLLHTRMVDSYEQLSLNQPVPAGLYVLRIRQGTNLVHLQQLVITR